MMRPLRVEDRARPAACLLVALVLGACSADQRANDAYTACKRSMECGRGRVCYKGYCVQGDGGAGMDGSMPDAMMGGGDAGVDATRPDTGPPIDEDSGMDEDAGAMPPGEACSEEGALDACYSGPPGSQIKGNCKAGLKTCIDGVYGPCINEIVPAPQELCNGEDDDCDDEVDEDTENASCMTPMPGNCMEGVAVCRQGSPVCAQIVFPETEMCDRLDNDCDGELDEGAAAEASCYPAGMPGCTLVGGVYECKGICKAGVIRCVDGQTQPCEDFVTPAAMEDCTPPPNGGRALNEDCDDLIDEMCPGCTDQETRACYGGPEGTVDNPPCAEGTQTCNGSTWNGDCVDDELPGVESCANPGVDNDCDGEEDNVPTEHNACVDDDLLGRCRNGTLECMGGALECATPEPRTEQCDTSDDDCDGEVDEGFDLDQDEAHCGACDAPACAQTCCDGTCVNTQTSEMYCGACNVRCGSGFTCCGGQCFNLQSDNQHCGNCTTVCGALTACCRGACRLLSLGC